MFARKPQVLLVDFSRQRETYAESLQRRGFCTLQASTADDAYRLATELQPDAIVTAVALPGNEDGWTLAERCKLDQRTSDVPVVVVSRFVSPHDRDVAVSSACELVVTRPCPPEELSVTVSALIRRAAQAARSATPHSPAPSESLVHR